LVAAYFLGAAALVYFYSRNPYNQISYTDLILPTRWSELRTKRGQTYIDEGLAKLKAGQYAPAFMLLNQGLARKPDNIPARLVVGQMYASFGYLNRAMQVYREGLPYAADQHRFVTATFQLAEYMEDYELVLNLVSEAEAAVPANATLMRRLLQEKRILAYEKLGRYDDILALWETNRATPSMRLNAARLRALSGTGKGAEAIAALEANPSHYGLLHMPWELLLELAKENNRPEVGRLAVNTLVALEPTRHRFYAKRIAYLSEIGAEQEALTFVHDYFLRFGGDAIAASTLLKEIEQNPTKALNDQIWGEIQSVGTAGPVTRAYYVHNLMRLGEISLAKNVFEIAKAEIIQRNLPDKGWLQGTEILLELLQADTPSSRSLLLNTTRSLLLSPDNLRNIISILKIQGRDDAAREVSMLAQNRFPAIRDLPRGLFDTPKQDAIAANTPILRTTHQVIPITQANVELDSLKSAISTAKWEDALTHIEIVEKSPLARNLGDQLFYWRIMIHGHLSQQTEISWYMRRLLEPGKLEPARLRALASGLHSQGYHDSALTILREVLRKHPEAKWASDLIRNWTSDFTNAPVNAASESEGK
jgi:tetratricopeptide (TPR) repeat protein